MTPQGRFWHPFSNMGKVDGNEVVFVRGEGCELTDRDGGTYLDAAAALWYCNVGYGRREIAEAMGAQAATLAACSCFDLYCSDTTLELAERVAEMAPVDGGVTFLTSGGSDSIETAAKIIRRHFAETGRPEKRVILSRERAYHGMHAYGTSLAGIEANRAGFEDLIPETLAVDGTDAGALAAEIDRLGPERVAAFFAEPMIGAGGVYPPPDGYLPEVAAICAERGVMLVADEVVSGFGRTGRTFACERYGIVPDALVLAKGMTSGYAPLGAVVFSGEIADPFFAPDSEIMLRHGYTYSGHATACAAGIANLDILEREGLVGRVAELEPVLAERLGALTELPAVSEVRTVGLTAAVQFAAEALDRDPDLAARAVVRSRELGVLTRVLAGGALHVSPPFVIEPEQIGRIAGTFGEAIEAESTSRSRERA